MNIRTSTTSLGLNGLAWNAFSVATAASAYAKITAPSFTVDKITTVLGAASLGLSSIILTVASGGVAPAWAQPGASVTVNVTKGGVPIVFGGVIRDVSSDGKTLTFAMNPLSGNSLSVALTAAALDAIAAGIVNTITLNIHCQKAMFNVQSGANISIAPVADANGANAPYSVSLAAGGSEYEVTAPTGAKFDLADWWVKSASGTPSLTVRFL